MAGLYLRRLGSPTQADFQRALALAEVRWAPQPKRSSGRRGLSTGDVSLVKGPTRDGLGATHVGSPRHHCRSSVHAAQPLIDRCCRSMRAPSRDPAEARARVGRVRFGRAAGPGWASAVDAAGVHGSSARRWARARWCVGTSLHARRRRANPRTSSAARVASLHAHARARVCRLRALSGARAP